MSYIWQFENFDPYDEEVPSYPFDLLPTIAKRARNLLSRSREQIVQIAETADWIIEEYFHKAKEEYVRYLLKDSGWKLEDLPQEERTETAIRNFMESGFPGIANDPRTLFANADNTSLVTVWQESFSCPNLGCLFGKHRNIYTPSW